MRSCADSRSHIRIAVSSVLFCSRVNDIRIDLGDSLVSNVSEN
jgi:hypothetical protein